MAKTFFIYSNAKNRVSNEIMEIENIKVGEKMDKDSSLFDKSNFVDCGENQKEVEKTYKLYVERNPNKFVWIASCDDSKTKEVWVFETFHTKEQRG